MASYRVVVVEDDEDILQLLREVLEGDGFQVIGLEHPQSALILDGQPEPDLFVLDLMLPGIDGIELARRLRDDGYPDTPMVAMSASDLMLEAAVDTHDFQDILPKPFDLSRFLETVGRFIT